MVVRDIDVAILSVKERGDRVGTNRNSRQECISRYDVGYVRDGIGYVEFSVGRVKEWIDGILPIWAKLQFSNDSIRPSVYR
jgi:hypothetical protein